MNHTKRLLITTMAICVLFAGFLAFAAAAHAEPANTYVYIVNYGTNSISVISPITLSKVTDISVANNPDDLVINSAGTRIYVSYLNNKYIDVIDTSTFSIIKHIYLTNNITGNQDNRLAISSDGTTLYVAAGNDNKILRIDASTGTILSAVNNLNGAICYYQGYLYVGTSNTSAYVFKLDGTTLNTVATTGGLRAVQDLEIGAAVDQNYNVYTKLYASNSNGTITNISLNPFAASGMYNAGYNDVIYGFTTNNSGYVFACVDSTGKIAEFSPWGVLLKNITLPTTLYTGIAYNQYNRTLFVCQYYEGCLYVVNADTGSTIASGSIGNKPYRIMIGTQSSPVTTMVTFKLVGLWGAFLFPNVNTSCYDPQGNLIASGLTDDAGDIAFYLSPTTNYKIVFFNATQNIYVQYNVTPGQSNFYQIGVPIDQMLWLTNINNNFLTVPYITISQASGLDTSSGVAYVDVGVTDSKSTTTSVLYTLYVNNTLFGSTATPIAHIQSTQTVNGVFWGNFTIDNAAGNSYSVTIYVVTTGSNYTYYTTRSFPGPKVLGGLLPLSWYPWMWLGGILICVSVGTRLMRGFWAVTTSISAVILGPIFGWTDTTSIWSGASLSTAIWPAAILCFVIGIAVFMYEREAQP